MTLPDVRQGRVVRVVLQIPLTVPVDALNEQEAREMALERVSQGVSPDLIREALEDQAAQVTVVNVMERTDGLPAMDLPMEYDAPRVR